MALIGTRPMNRRWTPQVRVGIFQSPPEEFITDVNLPIVGQDPRYPNTDYITIARGRMIAVRHDAVNGPSDTYSRAILTLADGVDPDNMPAVGYYGSGTRPIGFTESNLYRKWQEHIQTLPTVDKQALIEVPYIPTIQGAYGTLYGGDKLTAYYGSATSAAVLPTSVGQLSKWVPRRVYVVHQAAAATCTLTGAILPAFPPRIIWAANNGTANTSSPTLTYTTSQWSVAFTGNVTDVMFDYGQGYDQVCGEVVKLEGLSSTHSFEGWLQWVQDDFRAWEYPPQSMRVPTTNITAENPVYNAIGNYRLANYPLATWLPINVVLAPTGGNTFTVTNAQGVVTPVASATTYTLDVPSLPMIDYSYGTYHQLNPVTGQLFISPDSVVFLNSGGAPGTYPSAGSVFTQIQVTYAYQTAYRDGRLYAAGQIGITDGMAGSGYPGTPANLDQLGSAGAMRALIY